MIEFDFRDAPRSSGGNARRLPRRWEQGLQILTVPASAGFGRVEAELASVVAELSGSTWADGNVRGPMQPTFYQLTVAGAMLVNAIVGHMLYRAAFADAGHEPIIAAT